MPDQYTSGDVIIRRHNHGTDDDHTEVLSATPHALIADQLLNDIHANPAPEFCELVIEQAHEHVPRCHPEPEMCFTDCALHINARNRKYIYRIGNYRPEHHAWEMSWPD